MPAVSIQNLEHDFTQEKLYYWTDELLNYHNSIPSNAK